ncbi:hypothetical protein CRUP_010916 [Coryphaenoides rupestris]|nr:hypothetical protein CRUP_010916 [Coryphaenoides rupestris]
MSANFQSAASFIHGALSRGGRVLVHCHVGVSRSATLVLAYLMLKQKLTLVDAICAVKDKRGVVPNRGFLRQLIQLDGQLFGPHRCGREQGLPNSPHRVNGDSHRNLSAGTAMFVEETFKPRPQYMQA